MMLKNLPEGHLTLLKAAKEIKRFFKIQLNALSLSLFHTRTIISSVQVHKMLPRGPPVSPLTKLSPLSPGGKVTKPLKVSDSLTTAPSARYYHFITCLRQKALLFSLRFHRHSNY